MNSYRGTANRPDRIKAAMAVVAVHAVLAAVILTGLNVKTMRRAVETMTTIVVIEPEPPPPQATRPNPAFKEAGAPGRTAEPTSVVAPPPKIPVQSPIPAAPVAGQGSATTAGAVASGSGTGAGGSGTGRGSGAGFTPARRISKIPDREYRRLAATGIAAGSVDVTIKVNEDGGVSNCRVSRSSGDQRIDALMCDLTLRHVRFDPARDPRGRPVAQDVTFVPNWWRP